MTRTITTHLSKYERRYIRNISIHLQQLRDSFYNIISPSH